MKKQQQLSEYQRHRRMLDLRAERVEREEAEKAAKIRAKKETEIK